ncbi:unnamed protein product, partial [Musa textilis]
MQVGSAFNHRYVKSNPREVENATASLNFCYCILAVSSRHSSYFLFGIIPFALLRSVGFSAPVSMAVLRFMGDWNEAMH